MADGIKRAVKGGMVTLQKLLDEAMVSGDLLNLDVVVLVLGAATVKGETL